ncbi:MAG: glycosyltransferase family 4 protein [Candidatus Daviesbacteria bacterium]|nr:glycosyltransferase family 4 protein [Candidatus Daviesbacteria bacterium]
MIKTFHIFANAALGKGLSGGDRIFIEFAKRLRQKNEVIIHVWKEGLEMCQRQGLTERVKFERINVDRWCKFGFIMCYLARVIKSVWSALFLNLDNPKDVILFSASEFWMDSLPGFILKLRYSETQWVVGAFQVAPNPLKGFTQGSRENTYRLSALVNWLAQLPIDPMVKRWVDIVLVNNETERKYFKTLDKQGKVLVILGAVNTDEINDFRLKNEFPKIYDAVFQGRFHPQKGVGELVEIWKLVTEKEPKAKLAMIGDGPLMNDVRLKIKDLRLEKNIKLFGYVFDGPIKYKIFSQSKLVVHPSFFDSGGMASAEAMAFGMPCVGFNLESYKSYYPQGMVKVKIGDLNKFAEEILALLGNEKKREQIGKEAQDMIDKSWSWDQRVNSLLTFLPTS